MVSAASPSFPNANLERIIALLFRCTYVEGSTTLITRCAVLGWISTWLEIKAGNVQEAGKLNALAAMLHDSSDKQYIKQWSGGN